MTSKTEHGSKKSEDGVWEIIKVILQALLIAFVIRTFFFQPFNIPSGSMIPTLRVGDYLFVNKLSYGYGPNSFNFSIVPFGVNLFKFGPLDFKGRIFAGRPERGDVVVFKQPSNNDVDFIKRVIGLPGDKIQLKTGVLFINGVAVKRSRIDDFQSYEAGRCERSGPVTQYRETLANGVSYITHDCGPGDRYDDTQVYEVPDGHYFMLGDNRDNSTDSRVLGHVGYVPYENIVGRATILFFSHQAEASLFKVWEWPFVIRWNRLFNVIK